MTKIQKTENKGNWGCSTEWYNIWDNRSPEAKPFASLSFNTKRNKNPHSPGAQEQLKWWQCWQILESDSHKQPSNELPDIRRGYDFINLTSQIPNSSPHETVEDLAEIDEDEADILEWNPEDDKDDLGGTDEDLVIVMTRNSNNNEDVTQVMWLDGQNF